jgi:hypothetical protein
VDYKFKQYYSFSNSLLSEFQFEESRLKNDKEIGGKPSDLGLPNELV